MRCSNISLTRANRLLIICRFVAFSNPRRVPQRLPNATIRFLRLNVYPQLAREFTDSRDLTERLNALYMVAPPARPLSRNMAPPCPLLEVNPSRVPLVCLSLPRHTISCNPASCLVFAGSFSSRDSVQEPLQRRAHSSLQALPHSRTSYRTHTNGHCVNGQVLDSDRSGGLDSQELCVAMRKLVRVVGE